MRELILKLCIGRKELFNILEGIDIEELSRGRITVTVSMLENLLRILSGSNLEIKVSSIDSEGKIHLYVKKGVSAEFSYELFVDTMILEHGHLYGILNYKENHGGGVGGKLLGLTGKSGLAFALSSYKWIKVDNNKVEFSLSGLPQSLFCSLARVTSHGITFKI